MLLSQVIGGVYFICGSVILILTLVVAGINCFGWVDTPNIFFLDHVTLFILAGAFLNTIGGVLYFISRAISKPQSNQPIVV